MDDVQDIRDGYAAFASADLDAVMDRLAPDVLWHVPGRSSLSGTLRGRGPVLGYFGQLFEQSGGTFAVELLECGEIARGLVGALVRVTADMPAGRIDQRMVQVFRREHGLTKEVSTFASDQYAIDESDSRTPAGIVRQGYEAFGRGDLATLTTLLAHDVAWHEPGRSAMAGTHRGIPAVLALFGQLFELSAGTFRTELIGCAEVAPGLVTALARQTAVLPGGSIDTTNVHVFRIADGLVTEVVSHPADAEAFDDAAAATEAGAAIRLPDARTPVEPART